MLRTLSGAVVRRAAAGVICLAIAGCASALAASNSPPSSTTLYDEARRRPVPVRLYFPSDVSGCTLVRPCSVALISSGYGIGSDGYSFVSDALAALGYLTVAVQHELPTDPPLATKGDLFAARTPDWQRGAGNLRFVRDTLRRSHPGFDWDHPVLIGHSNGGDISAWLLMESPSFASALVTLDSRRVPLPRGPSTPRMLSIRASDFQADAGVLPGPGELEVSGGCIVRIDGARHNDMHDGGPDELKATIVDSLVRFLGGSSCDALMSAGSDQLL